MVFLLGLGITRALGLDVSIWHVAGASLLLAAAADIVVAIANERFNAGADAKRYARNEPVGEKAVVVDAFTPSGTSAVGRVRAHGQIWSGRCDGGLLLETGQKVRVVDREGLILIVEPDAPPGGGTIPSTDLL